MLRITLAAALPIRGLLRRHCGVLYPTLCVFRIPHAHPSPSAAHRGALDVYRRTFSKRERIMHTVAVATYALNIIQGVILVTRLFSSGNLEDPSSVQSGFFTIPVVSSIGRLIVTIFSMAFQIKLCMVS